MSNHYETNIILYVNYTSVKKIFSRKSKKCETTTKGVIYA